ncbi:alpha/beta fold hydrolase [Streptomyces sp. V4I2]|uniref:alpha/beta fold hydrolase n=1 Tax=Streptomyces sp. V4I2 TaxID=3042280 RepID=UPI002783B267|nr:alpha/beta fold hydrolase [Streptomyces sp. V4I2]MDQ1051147.1 pimeloyl-ACP methyl ester carboxylesterase [Streptomyces sp. V4I2]
MTPHQSHGEQLLKINGTELCVETFGDRATPPIMLVAGSAASMLWWDAELCEQIAARGRFVVRYDHRDTGRSACYPPGQPAYSFTDLTLDVLGIQDVSGIERAHVVCQSMFGGIGLMLGVDHPDRVASLTFVSSSTGADDLPPPSSDLAMPAEPDASDAAAVVEYVVAASRAYAGGSPYFDEAEIRALVERDVARARSYASTLVNHYAIEFDGPARGGFGDIAAPTLVVHGDHDPLLPPAHGEALRDAIPGAELLVLEGAGHDLPRPVWDDFVSALARHTEGGRS